MMKTIVDEKVFVAPGFVSAQYVPFFTLYKRIAKWESGQSVTSMGGLPQTISKIKHLKDCGWFLQPNSLEKKVGTCGVELPCRVRGIGGRGYLQHGK